MVSEKHIRWSEQETEYTDKGQSAASMLLWWILSAWFAFVTRQMIAEGIAVGIDKSGMAFKCLVLLVTFAIVFWNRYTIEHKLARIVGKLLIAVGCIIALVLNYGRADSDLPGGLLALVRMYADLWKGNFGTDFGIAYGNTNAGAAALDFVILVVLIVVLLAAVRMRRSILLSVMPLSVLGLSLLVNVKPRWESLALLFAGVVVSVYLDRVGVFRLKQLSLLTLVVCLIVGLMPSIMQKPAEHVYEIKEDFLAVQHNLEQGIKDFDLQKIFTDNASVTNEAPEYEEKEVILLRMEQKPNTSIYLRGYHRSKYMGGVWKKSGAFSRSCKEQGIAEADAAEMLLGLQNNDNSAQLQYTVEYTGIRDRITYLPYGISVGDTETAFELSGDYLAQKSKRVQEYTVTCDEQAMLSGFLLGGGTLSEAERAFGEWYSTFVKENYMGVPDDQHAVKKIAGELKKDFPESVKYITTLENGTESKDEINWARLILATMVTEKLGEEYSYSLELQELPRGQDPIEYFLSTGKKGYCVHFASAAVLMLREMGVPARYTTGYMVKSQKVRRSQDGYAVSVKDSDSHAWVEIYLEEYGWMPWEVTPGFNDYDIGYTEHVPDNLESQESTEDTESTESSTEEEINPEEVPEEETSGETESEDNDDQEELPANDGNTDENTTTGTTYNTGRKVLPIIIFMIVLLVSVVYWKSHKKKTIGRKQLNTYIRRGDTRRIILQMNREIYQAVLTRSQHRSILSDTVYFELLQNSFPEVEKEAWEQYFETVRKATYSIADISEEDVQKCYKVYYIITKKVD